MGYDWDIYSMTIKSRILPINSVLAKVAVIFIIIYKWLIICRCQRRSFKFEAEMVWSLPIIDAEVILIFKYQTLNQQHPEHTLAEVRLTTKT